MPYSKQSWFDDPSGHTTIDAGRLDHLESGIAASTVTAESVSPIASAAQAKAVSAQTKANTALSTAQAAQTTANDGIAKSIVTAKGDLIAATAAATPAAQSVSSDGRTLMPDTGESTGMSYGIKFGTSDGFPLGTEVYATGDIVFRRKAS